MSFSELGYKVEEIPELSLKKYSALEENGVEGVLKKHLAFLRSWARKGILSDVSIHLFYFYDGRDKKGRYAVGKKGEKIKIFFLVRGEEKNLENVPNLVKASALSDYYTFTPCSFSEFVVSNNIENVNFDICSCLAKKEVFVSASVENAGSNSFYYSVPAWEMNEKGRLYNMFKIMGSLDKQMLFRIDLYPADMSDSLRKALKNPIAVLRERQHPGGSLSAGRDYEGENILRQYEDMLEAFETSSHFICNAFVFADDIQNSSVVLDAAVSEGLNKGNFEIASFEGNFCCRSFLDGDADEEYSDRKNRMLMKKADKGYVICKEDAARFLLRYLPVLFTLEEVLPLFRFPVLYDGENISIRKETTSSLVLDENGIYLGNDDNGYDIYMPLKNLAKHGFISGVPGSGKTNAMHHLTSTLWKKHKIPFLVLEPAKKEYRALLNQEGMEELHLFSPNADMTFPLHINPFEFPKGMTLSEHIRTLEMVFEGAFPLEAPAPFILDNAIEAIYKDNGWTAGTVNTGKLPYPTLSDLYEKFEEIVKNTDYDSDIRGNLKSVLQVRIGSLMKREMGDIFDVPYSSVEPEKWLSIPAVIELEAMGTAQANFMTLLVCALIRETLRIQPDYDGEFARHVIFIEEAHNLIGPVAEDVTDGSDPKQAATAFIVKMLAEVRALKEGIVIADQLPTVMAPEVLKNTGFKLGLRLTASDDRALLASTMSANSVQTEEMSVFDVGRALLTFEGLKRPFFVQTHEWCGQYNTENCLKKNCNEKCSYYKSGDCIPDADKRAAVTVPKNDRELSAALGSNKAYKESCDRSVAIEGKKLYRDFCSLNKKTDKTLDLFRHLESLTKEIAYNEDKLVSVTENLLSEKERYAKQELKSEISAIGDYITELVSQKNEIKETETFSTVYTLIKSCFEFSVKVCEKLNRWEKAGYFDCENAKNNGKNEDERKDALRKMQKCILIDAENVFDYAKEYLSDADAIEDSFVQIKKKLGIN